MGIHRLAHPPPRQPALPAPAVFHLKLISSDPGNLVASVVTTCTRERKHLVPPRRRWQVTERGRYRLGSRIRYWASVRYASPRVASPPVVWATPPNPRHCREPQV